jgi:hypothetical protein
MGRYTMDRIMTDNSIEKIAYQVDDFISLMVTTHRLDPLTLGSIIMARLMLANQYFGSGDEFRQLMINIPEVKSKAIEAIH